MSSAQGLDMEIEAGFAPDDDEGRWTYAGMLTFANAGPVLAASSALTLPARGEVDLENIGAIDSSAVAVLVALARRAAEEGRTLKFVHIPSALVALAEVYGVGEILGA
jgi:phospholipid transport system transporter-binding protein